MSSRFNDEQAFIAVSLAHLLECALEGDDPSIWHDRARKALADYTASRKAESIAVRANDDNKEETTP